MHLRDNYRIKDQLTSPASPLELKITPNGKRKLFAVRKISRLLDILFLFLRSKTSRAIEKKEEEEEENESWRKTSENRKEKNTDRNRHAHIHIKLIFK